MNDFYRVTDPLSRPRIFAVVTSSTAIHFDSAMVKLENTLHAKVFGISDEKRKEILALPDRPTEVVVLYEPHPMAETNLYKQLSQLDQSPALFRHHFRAARYALTEVGACASDLVWRRAFKEIEVNVVPSYDAEGEGDSQPLKAKLDIRDIIKNWAFTMPNLDSTSREFNVTPKFSKLVEILQSCKPSGEAFRGIVFGEFSSDGCSIMEA
jgi:endoribonuclease Dicer